MGFPGKTNNLLISCVKIGASAGLLYMLAGNMDLAAIGGILIDLPAAAAAWCLILFAGITFMAGDRKSVV